MKTHFSDKAGESKSAQPRVPSQKEIAALQIAMEAIHEIAEIGRLLRNTTALLESMIHLAAGTGELTSSHLLVLVHLLPKSNCKQVDLKSATHIGPAYLSRLLDELVHQGLLRRHRSLSDRRQILLTLTERGKEATRHLLVSMSELMTNKKHAAIVDLGSSLNHFGAVMDD